MDRYSGGVLRRGRIADGRRGRAVYSQKYADVQAEKAGGAYRLRCETDQQRSGFLYGNAVFPGCKG